MKVIIGKTAGFCFGVKRAVETSMKMALKTSKIYCLGELVHNEEVIKELSQEGIIFINSIDEIKDDNATLIIRAHGTDQETIQKALNNKIEVIDSTCPLVAKTHQIASKYQAMDYYIFLLGTKSHPEIIGTSSYCGNNYSLIEDENDLDLAISSLLESKCHNLLVIVQTTYSTLKYSKIVKLINDKIGSKVNILFKNTICMATEERQKETKELSKKVDLMIIIGGKNSSNTQKLYEIASQNTKSLLIQNSEELDLDSISEDTIIGIMAGASTPQKSIEDVVKKIKEF